jgi:hypothetical protein
MPTVATLSGSIRIEQRYNEHHPPHFHAIQGDDEAQIDIANLSVIAGTLDARALADVVAWARDHRMELALNWVDALAQKPLQRIRFP